MAADLFFTPSGAQLDCPSCKHVIHLGDKPVTGCGSCGWTPDGVTPVTPRAPKPLLAGIPRNGWACIGLGIVTLGIYFVYWRYAVFREVHEQEGTRHWTALFWAELGLAFASIVSALVDFQRAGGFRAAAEDPTFHLSTVTILLALWAAILLGIYLVRESSCLNVAARARRATLCYPWMFAVIAVVEAVGHATTVPGSGPDNALGVVGTILALVAYPLAQATLNDYWRSFETSAPTGTPVAAVAV